MGGRAAAVGWLLWMGFTLTAMPYGGRVSMSGDGRTHSCGPIPLRGERARPIEVGDALKARGFPTAHDSGVLFVLVPWCVRIRLYGRRLYGCRSRGARVAHPVPDTRTVGWCVCGATLLIRNGRVTRQRARYRSLEGVRQKPERSTRVRRSAYVCTRHITQLSAFLRSTVWKKN